MSKVCFKCNTRKPLKEYYKNPRMKDGHFNKCKDCAKKDAKIRTIPRVCDTCGKSFMTWPSEIRRGSGSTCSRSCYYKHLKRIVKREENSPNWKGNAVQYGALHDWVRRQLGTPSKCDFCGITEGIFDWSNISWQYKRDLTDWQRLCRRCHIAYDNHSIKRKETLMKRYDSLNMRKFYRDNES